MALAIYVAFSIVFSIAISLFGFAYAMIDGNRFKWSIIFSGIVFIAALIILSIGLLLTFLYAYIVVALT